MPEKYTNRPFAGAIASRILVALVFALSATLAWAQATTLEVITLRNRTAEQIIPVLKPLLDKNGTMTGMQNQLIVRTTAANLADLKKVLATLDAQPRQLMITVRQDALLDRERTQADIGGRISTGTVSAGVSGSGNTGGGTVTVQRGNDIVRGRIDSTRALDSDRNTQTVRVLEGSSAFIRTGVSVPVPNQVPVGTVINGRLVGTYGGGTVEYQNVTSGFYVVPRLAGDQVTLEIRPQNDTLARPEQNLPRGSYNVQQASTTVSGRLGEWIEVGGFQQGGSSQQSTILGSTRELSQDNRQILLKVDEVR